MVGFIASMLLLVGRRRVLLLFLGWEGLGVSSFFLINYYQSYYSTGSSIKTLIINRIGDVCFVFVLVVGGGTY